MKLYGLKDELTGFQENILIFANDDAAARSFAAVINDPGNQMSLWYKDYSIWYLGEVNKTTGEIHQETIEPRLIVRGESVKRKEEKE